MRSNIPRRLRQLEQKAHIHDPPQPVIFVTFVSLPYQSSRAECIDQTWERMPEETEQDFRGRVLESLQRDEHSPTFVILHPRTKTEAPRTSEITD
jgi:hypothetical protein